jgi:hypothetical protein
VYFNVGYDLDNDGVITDLIAIARRNIAGR